MRRVAGMVLAVGLLSGILAVATPGADAAATPTLVSTHIDQIKHNPPSLVRMRTRDTGHASARLVESAPPATIARFAPSAIHASSTAVAATPVAVGLGRRAPSRAPPR